MGVANGDGRYEVCCGQHIYKGCCHGGTDGGIEFPVVESWREYFGDAAVKARALANGNLGTLLIGGSGGFFSVLMISVYLV